MKNTIVLVLALGHAVAFAQLPAYKNPSLPVEARLEDLLRRMTLEEQVAQLCGFFSRDTLAFDANGNYVGTQDTAVLNQGVGSYATWALRRTQSPRYRVACINGIQRYMIQRSRLGIPVFTFGESLHGFMAEGATSFPQAIALGCTWDTTLVEQVFTVAAREASARGSLSNPGKHGP